MFLPRSFPPLICGFDDALQCMKTGLYVGAMVVLKMYADGTELLPEDQGKTGKLLEFKKAWCKISVGDKVIAYRKKYLKIHPDSQISQVALKKKFLQQKLEREELRKVLEANIVCSDPAPTTASRAADDETPSVPIDITPVQDLINRAWVQHIP